MAEVEQLLEDKYLSMKCVKGWEEEEDDYALFASPAKKKGPKTGHKSANCPDKKAKKKRTLKTSLIKKRRKNPRRTIMERAKLIYRNLSALIVAKWVILPGTARNRAKTLI